MTDEILQRLAAIEAALDRVERRQKGEFVAKDVADIMTKCVCLWCYGLFEKDIYDAHVADEERRRKEQGLPL